MMFKGVHALSAVGARVTFIQERSGGEKNHQRTLTAYLTM